MNIYQGLLFLHGYRVMPEHAAGATTAAAAPATSPACSPARARPATPHWQRPLRGLAAFAGLLPVERHPGCCC